MNVTPHEVGWEAIRPDGDRRSVEHVARVLRKWADRHAHRKGWLHTPAQIEYDRDPINRQTRVWAVVEYAELVRE